MAILTGRGQGQRRRPLAVVAITAALLAPLAARAQGPSLEYAVKAAYLYKFGPFVEWPPQAFASAASPFNVCVLGQDPFGAALDDAVRGQTVGGRPIAVRRMQTVSKAPPCQVLYLGRSRQQTASEILELLRGVPVLTVTDERAGSAGGVVHFVLRQGRVRFGVDARRAQANGLAISSKLLALAIPIDRGGTW